LVELFPIPPGLKVALQRGVETGVGEGALSPIPGTILLLPVVEDLGGGGEPEGVDEMQGKFSLVELEGLVHGLLLQR
jgi:hypothetical protein